MTFLVQEEKDYIDSFLFALKTTETKRQYCRNLKMFFNFGFEQDLSLQEQANLFIKNELKDTNWANSYFIQFFRHQIESRVNKKIQNYYRF